MNTSTPVKDSTLQELKRRIDISKEYINENLDKRLDLDIIAREACLSKYHFIRTFKLTEGQTPRQYIIKQRLGRAENLLTQTTKSFHEICLEVGRQDASSFGRLFKKTFGLSPNHYRAVAI